MRARRHPAPRSPHPWMSSMTFVRTPRGNGAGTPIHSRGLLEREEHTHRSLAPQAALSELALVSLEADFLQLSPAVRDASRRRSWRRSLELRASRVVTPYIGLSNSLRRSLRSRHRAYPSVGWVKRGAPLARLPLLVGNPAPLNSACAARSAARGYLGVCRAGSDPADWYPAGSNSCTVRTIRSSVPSPSAEGCP
jgi:hypothetical protein